MPVPKAAIDEDYCSKHGKNQIGASRKFFAMEAES
jgi:hypothetical protein